METPTPQNPPLNGSATAGGDGTSTTQSQTSFTPPSTRRRNPISDAASLINAGGLGRAAQPSSQTQTQTTTSQPPILEQAQPQQTPILTSRDIALALDKYDTQFLPTGPRSLSGIALRSFLLGITLSFTSLFTLYLLYTNQQLWRLPFFISVLSLFHFLEFYTTSLRNTSSAQISSFLLSSNGAAYFIAHSASIIETLIFTWLHPQPILPSMIHKLLLSAGLFLITVGQLTRALAMLTAGSNFSHIVRHTKSQTHVLVTQGIYGVLRHPSYFGFFWWGIGTQLVCGNAVCLVGYAVVLWVFFKRRIEGEEELLVGFFGGEYERYRGGTRVGIPFIK